MAVRLSWEEDDQSLSSSIYVSVDLCVSGVFGVCMRRRQSRQMQQPAADYTTECQLETEVALVLVHLNTNLLGPLSFGPVSAS